MSPCSAESTKSLELGGNLSLPDPMIEHAATTSSDVTITPGPQDGNATSEPITAAKNASNSGQSTPQLHGRLGFMRNLSALSAMLKMTPQDTSHQPQAVSMTGVAIGFDGGTAKPKAENSKPSDSKVTSGHSTPAQGGRAGMKRNISAMFKAASREHSPSGSSSRKSSLRDGDLGAQSPELLAMLKRDAAPDLESVNRALEELSMSANSTNRIARGKAVKSLESLASELKTAQEGCHTLLTQAMKHRDKGRTEVCRAMCVQIIHNKHSEPGIKIYAYNILSTLASVGQANNFLNESVKLVREHIKGEADRERLLRFITQLRHSAEWRDAKHSKEGRRERNDELPEAALEDAEEVIDDGEEIEMCPTPKSERILQWSTQDKK